MDQTLTFPTQGMTCASCVRRVERPPRLRRSRPYERGSPDMTCQTHDTVPEDASDPNCSSKLERIDTMRSPSIITRRQLFVASGSLLAFGATGGVLGLRSLSADDKLAQTHEVHRSVLPPGGYKTSVSFGDTILRLTAAEAVDPEKFRRLYKRRGGLPGWVDRLFAEPSVIPITFNRETAPYLLNLLWPLGLSTKTAFNDKSPLNSVRIPSFASTGGWRLGKARNGYVYFNRVDTMQLDAGQEGIVLEAASRTFRPCCNNSAFYQDCNHGSAMLGLFELAASQGATLEDLYRIGLAANAHWYPRQYVATALYFQSIEGKPWHQVPPETVLDRRYSSLSGWRANVDRPLQGKAPELRSAPSGGGACGI